MDYRTRYLCLKHKGYTQIQGQEKTEKAQDRVDLATPVRVGQMVLYVSISKSLSLRGIALMPLASQASSTDPAVESSEDNPLECNTRQSPRMYWAS